MNDYIFFMHDDAVGDLRNDDGWPAYLAKLRDAGAFQGGSSIGEGVCVSKSQPSAAITHRISGYIRVRAVNLEAARQLVVGNPVFEGGGTVEIRELPKSG